MVASAVIFFGALISIGNERQRRAIDGLKEQLVLWAIQDLRIKREHLTQNVRVPDPVGWLNTTVSKVYGYDMKLQILNSFDEPQSLVCTSGDNGKQVVLSPLSPTDISRIRSSHKNHISQFATQNPLLCMPRKVNTYEMSVLNGGAFFDLEISSVWKELTGLNLSSANQIWIYEY